MKKESDIYSFGVLLFEMFCGRLAYDHIYIDDGQKGLPHVVRNHFNDGTIKLLLDPKLKEVTNDDIFTSNREPTQDSLDTFLNIAHRCLEVAQAKRPPMEMVIKELEKALNLQENLMKSLLISLEDIELATEKFSQENYCGSGRYWKAYKGKLPHATIVAKRWDSEFNDQFRTELDILFNHKHKNIIGLVGFCNDTNEKIIVYEHMSKGSLSKYLKDSNLRWIKRLKICIDVASALEFLHEGDITLNKIGMVEGHEDCSQPLGSLAKHYYEQGKLDEIVFEDIKKQIAPQSLTTFANIAYRCLHVEPYVRPKASKVVIQLKRALEFQEDLEIWEPKLPRDYKEIMLLSETPEIYKKMDIYDKLSKGIHLPKKKVWLILSDNGEINKMVSATEAKFSYRNKESHKCRSIQMSRFLKVAKMLDITNLKIHVTLDNQFLSPDVIYGVYLVFKFSDPKIFSRKQRMYMNLKYKNGNDTLHSYFATWRDDKWMMIELHRFLNHKEYVSFTFLLESFSRYYCPSNSIYIEGIEFRSNKRMVHEDNKKQNDVQQVQELNSDLDKILTIDDKLLLTELNGKKHLMISATGVLYNSEKWEPLPSKSSSDSRFQNVVELLHQQVFAIQYKIKTQMLSPFTQYTCYLVFRLSKKCRGLHCPVKLRDPFYRRNKHNQIIYFRSPTLINHHDVFWVPKQMKDGWMEVMIWKFNSKNYTKKPGEDVIPMNLKLITCKGTMSGLIISGLEFRPM